MPILWSSQPPPKPPDGRVGLLAVKAGESVLCRILGPSWWCSCHWVNGRSILCTGAEECQVHHEPVNQKGFVAVVANGRDWRGPRKGEHRCVLVLTPEIGEFIATVPRGAAVEVSRRPGKANGPMLAALAVRQPATDCPEEFDPRPFVLRAMRLQSKKGRQG